MAVEGHLVGMGRRRDFIDADGLDAASVEELPRRPENALSRGYFGFCEEPAVLFKPAILPLDTVLTSKYLNHVTK